MKLSPRPFNRIHGGLYQGNTLYTVSGLQKAGIKTVVNVSDHADWQQGGLKKAGISYLHFPMEDNALLKSEEAALRQAASIVKEALQKGPVLVHCDFGLNRSGVTTARALMYLGLSADAAIAAVRKGRGDWALYNDDFVRWLRLEDLPAG